MELILWRHAEAEDGEPDEARELTGKGRRQAKRMAQWLDANLPSSTKILVSPAKRALQTVQALDRKFLVHPDLAQGMPAAKILRAANWPDAKSPVLLVGHQPAFGQLASLLLTGQEHDFIIRKGNVCWISSRTRDEHEENFLRALIGPDLALSK